MLSWVQTDTQDPGQGKQKIGGRLRNGWLQQVGIRLSHDPGTQYKKLLVLKIGES